MPDVINDNEHSARTTATLPPDPHGQAALLLVESLIHSMVAKGLLTTREAVDAVEIAQDVKVEIADDMGDTWESKRISLGLLAAISISLRGDL